jgi:hypothetical protein
MKIIVTKEELLELCFKCADNSLHGRCTDCIFGADCNEAYIDFWRDNTEVTEKGCVGK